ncbi:hypothetical protein D7X88_01250 [bacterium C-53]|nr:hypothetical protein [Lachnospiraceae bacterium]NBI01647.1 hypothetical protein [Lachnospiraceae bacterium]RKJ12941.1 hypothetical protein D7X88_01250 [bacterium C-53]
MLNEERIKLMTRMASYEADEGKRMIPVGNYFRNDYISFQVVKTAISATIAFGLIFAMYIYYDFEAFLADIYKMDVVAFVKTLVMLYLAAVVAYMLIAYILASYRYNKAKKSLRNYYAALRKLSQMYEEED